MTETPFIAHPPGTQNTDTYRQFVELQSYIQRLDDRLGREAIALLYGNVLIGTVGTGFSKLTNYADGASVHSRNARFPATVDPAAGEITIQEAGVYRFTFYVIAEQGNNAKEEQLELWLNATGQARIGLAVFDIATDKTAVRYLAGSVVRAVSADTYWLELSATAGLGDFGTGRASFEFERFL